MPASPDAVIQAYQLFNLKRYAEAEQLCRQLLTQELASASAVHLLGLIRKETGDPVGGEQLILRSIELEPQRAEFRANLGHLQRRLGRLHDAVTSYRSALAIEHGHRPARLGLARALQDLRQYSAAEAECRTLLSAHTNDAEVLCTLAGSLRQQQRLGAAESAYRKAMMLRPGYAVAHHNLGAMLSEQERAEEALSELEQAERLGAVTRESSINRGHSLLKLNRLVEAEQAYRQAVTLNPRDPEAHVSLAKLRFMRGEPDFSREFAAAAAAFPDVIALQLAFCELLRRSGDLLSAERVARDLLVRRAPDSTVHQTLASILREQGNLPAAEQQALQAVTLSPESSAAIHILVSVRLSRGRVEEAMPLIDQQRAREPRSQLWIALWLTAARLRADPLYHELCDYQTLVRCYDLSSYAGTEDFHALNSAVGEVLTRRHQLSRHPLDQSLRHGTQTTRGLLSDPDPAIQKLIGIFQAPLLDYAAAVRSHGNPLLLTHQVSQQGRPIISKCWSIRLGPGGFHVSHIHPEGWISSAYYVTVPTEVEDAATMPGWIKFGEPPFPAPGCNAQHFIQPRAGRLVLFPSFLWHGTNPIAGSSPRLTIAFDAMAR